MKLYTALEEVCTRVQVAPFVQKYEIEEWEQGGQCAAASCKGNDDHLDMWERGAGGITTSGAFVIE